MSISITNNGIFVTAVFKDGNDEPVDPDGPVTWTVYGSDRSVRNTQEQSVDSHEATGTYRFIFVPQIIETIYIEATAKVGGVDQTQRLVHDVRWVL